MGVVFRMKPENLRPLCHSRCGTIKIPPCKYAVSTEFCSFSSVMVMFQLYTVCVLKLAHSYFSALRGYRLISTIMNYNVSVLVYHELAQA
jgi:hypothetical protein